MLFENNNCYYYFQCGDIQIIMRRARVKAIATVPVRRKALNENSLETDIENASANKNSASSQDGHLSEFKSQGQNTSESETNQIDSSKDELIRMDTLEITTVKSENVSAPNSEDVGKVVEVTTSPNVNKIPTINVLKKGNFLSLS